MADREVAGRIIEEWVLSHEGERDEDDVEHKKGTSTTAYFHAKGNED